MGASHCALVPLTE